MRKLIFPLLLLTILVSACNGGATQAPTAQAPAAQAPTSKPANTEPAVATATRSVPTAGAVSEPSSGCTVVSRQPTPGPTEQSIFPPVGEADWIKGAADAKVTIIEYSDFQ